MSDMRNVPPLSLYMHKNNPFPKLFRMLKNQIKQTKAGNLKKKEGKQRKHNERYHLKSIHKQKQTHTILILKQAKHKAKQKDYVF